MNVPADTPLEAAVRAYGSARAREPDVGHRRAMQAALDAASRVAVATVSVPGGGQGARDWRWTDVPADDACACERCRSAIPSNGDDA